MLRNDHPSFIYPVIVYGGGLILLIFILMVIFDSYQCLEMIKDL